MDNSFGHEHAKCGNKRENNEEINEATKLKRRLSNSTHVSHLSFKKKTVTKKTRGSAPAVSINIFELRTIRMTRKRQH